MPTKPCTTGPIRKEHVSVNALNTKYKHYKVHANSIISLCNIYNIIKRFGWLKKKNWKQKRNQRWTQCSSMSQGGCIKNQHCSCVPEHKQCVCGMSCIYRFYHTNWKDVFRLRSERLRTWKFVFVDWAKEKKMKAAKFKSQALIMGVEALNWTTSSTQRSPTNTVHWIQRGKLSQRGNNSQSYRMNELELFHVQVHLHYHSNIWHQNRSVKESKIWLLLSAASNETNVEGHFHQERRNLIQRKRRWTQRERKWRWKENGSGKNGPWNSELQWGVKVAGGSRERQRGTRRESEGMSPDSWTMRTAVPGSWTDQKSLQNGKEDSWRTVGESGC